MNPLVRLYTAIARHTVLVMAAGGICAITAALHKPGTGAQATLAFRRGQPLPADSGVIALTVPEITQPARRPGEPDWRLAMRPMVTTESGN
jgi:hypothetical protein